MSIGVMHGLWSLFILLVFVGIVAWAWSGKRRTYFEEAGRIPFLNDDERPLKQNGHKP